MQNQYKFSIIVFRIMKNWRFDMILLCLKCFCYIENLIEWQNSRKAYKKQTLILTPFFQTNRIKGKICTNTNERNLRPFRKRIELSSTLTKETDPDFYVKGCSENRRLVNCDFGIVRIGRFVQIQRFWMRKICGISWVIIKNLWNENLACHIT